MPCSGEAALTSSPLKKVLLAYHDKIPLMRYMKPAFERQGIAVITFDVNANMSWVDRFFFKRINKIAHNLRIIPKSRKLFGEHPLSHRNYYNSRLRAVIEQEQPDLLFIVRGIDYEPSSYAPAPCRFAWWIESEDGLAEAYAEAAHFQHYFFISQSGVEGARQRGLQQVSYLPHGVDPSVFQPQAIERDIDVGFVGFWSPRRQRYLEAVLDVTRHVVIYGPRWWKNTWRLRRFWRIVRGRAIHGDRLVHFYNRCKLVLNVTNWGEDGGPLRSGMNMRLFEVPATGRPLLTDRCRELDSSFLPGQELAVFDSPEELREQVQYYLEHAAAREAMAAAGRQRVLASASYDLMIARICAAYEDWRTRQKP